MDAFSLSLLEADRFMPHGHCILWTPSLLWLYIVSDSVIGLAYFSIPVALVYFARKRRDLQFNWMFVLFSLFIFACGTTHFIALWTIWNPVYWLDASVRAVTALVSLVTAILLWPLIPRALRLPSPENLRTVIGQMEKEVSERKKAEVALAQFNESLEQRVADRTAELEESNRRLAAEVEARKGAEERFRRVVEHAPSGMVITSRDGTIEMVNELTEHIFGYDRTELVGSSIEKLVPERYRHHHPQLRDTFFAQPETRPMGEGRDLYGVRKGGSEVPVEVALNPIRTETDVMVLAAIVDISDRKQKEERLQAALREKTTLLSEVHHRVKNNLQLIHSLLDLQVLQTQDPELKAVLENSKQRIKSMSLIHQALYQSDDVANVDMNDVLQKLIDSITGAYALEHEKISLAMEVEPVNMPISQAIPCGLIVNELVTNAMKYAFPASGSGEILVKLASGDDDRVHLSVSDNGVGLGPEVDMDNLSSLGLELVSVLSMQISGELSINRANPTRFDIWFRRQQ